jgi:RNA polymerase sigma-70 factor (ECF subfamily)
MLLGEQKALLQHFMGFLPALYQDVLHLRFYRGLTYREISEETGIPLGTVKARLVRAKGLLLDLIETHTYTKHSFLYL